MAEDNDHNVCGPLINTWALDAMVGSFLKLGLRQGHMLGRRMKKRYVTNKLLLDENFLNLREVDPHSEHRRQPDADDSERLYRGDLGLRQGHMLGRRMKKRYVTNKLLLDENFLNLHPHSKHRRQPDANDRKRLYRGDVRLR
uniref:Uncharacterized protein n=1 Tax=Steinernema glaseri TaxID=37863 RepID=A0A1I7YFB1_9BILA